MANSNGPGSQDPKLEVANEGELLPQVDVPSLADATVQFIGKQVSLAHNDRDIMGTFVGAETLLGKEYLVVCNTLSNTREFLPVDAVKCLNVQDVTDYDFSGFLDRSEEIQPLISERSFKFTIPVSTSSRASGTLSEFGRVDKLVDIDGKAFVVLTPSSDSEATLTLLHVDEILTVKELEL